LGTSTDLQSSPSATISAIIVPTFMSLVSSRTCRMTMHYNMYSPVLQYWYNKTSWMISHIIYC
jgi:hypothetical protein